MPPGEDPNKPKKRRDEQAEKAAWPETNFEPTLPEDSAYDRRVDDAPSLIARHGDDIARGVIGEWWDSPHRLVAFGARSSYVVQVFEQREKGQPVLLGTNLKEVATPLFMEAAVSKRPLVCLLSLSGALAVNPRRLTDEERSSRVLAHQAAAWLAKDRLGRRDVEDGRKPLLDLLAEISQPSFTPRCHIISDVAMVAGGRRPWRFRAASGENWYLVRPSEAFNLVASAMEALGRRESEFLLLLTSLPKGCEPWLVGEKSQAARLHEAVDRALEGISTPAAEEPLAEVSAPINGVALARSVWQSLRAEMKEVIEARVRQLSQLTLETFEQKREVEAELRMAMDAWGFRAVAPRSGKPAYLRCRVQERNPYGQFYFSDVPRSEVVQPPDPEGVVASAQVPLFSLTDALADSRPSGTS